MNNIEGDENINKSYNTRPNTSIMYHLLNCPGNYA